MNQTVIDLRKKIKCYNHLNNINLQNANFYFTQFNQLCNEYTFLLDLTNFINNYKNKHNTNFDFCNYLEHKGYWNIFFLDAIKNDELLEFIYSIE